MKVIFKKDTTNNNEIIAFMPYDICNWQGDFTCYAHIGQHSTTNYNYYLRCKPATQEEYKSLYNELKNIGYEIEVIKKINTKKLQIAYKDFMATYKF